MNLFLVGKVISQTEAGSVWEVQGIFSTEELAVAACHGPNYCVMPLTLDEELSDAPEQWGYYPKASPVKLA